MIEYWVYNSIFLGLRTSWLLRYNKGTELILILDLHRQLVIQSKKSCI